MAPPKWNRKVRRVEGCEQVKGSKGPVFHPFAYERGVDGVVSVMNRGGGPTVIVTKKNAKGEVYVHAIINTSHCSQILYMEPED